MTNKEIQAHYASRIAAMRKRIRDAKKQPTIIDEAGYLLNIVHLIDMMLKRGHMSLREEEDLLQKKRVLEASMSELAQRMRKLLAVLEGAKNE